MYMVAKEKPLEQSVGMLHVQCRAQQIGDDLSEREVTDGHSSEEVGNSHLLDIHLSRVDLQNSGTGILIRLRELNLTVQTPGPQQSRVQHINTVCRCYHLRYIRYS